MIPSTVVKKCSEIIWCTYSDGSFFYSFMTSFWFIKKDLKDAMHVMCQNYNVKEIL